MSNLRYYIIFLLTLFSLFLISSNLKENADIAEKSFLVKIVHPAQLDSIPYKITMHKFIDVNSNQLTYRAIVNSVFCSEQICKSVPITMYWDELGAYKKFELFEGKQLEKTDAELFTEADYLKLNEILVNKNSIFKNTTVAQLSTETHGTEEVDAVSGATQKIDEKELVKGALWTSYTMWHWANGNVCKIIRDNRADASTFNGLMEGLKSENTNEITWAIEQLKRKNIYSDTILNVVNNLKSDKSTNISRVLIDYLENSETKFYFHAIEKLLFESESIDKALLINSVAMTKHKFSISFVEKLSGLFTSTTNYPIVNQLFFIIERSNFQSPTINGNALFQLKNNILNARRAYWFLKNQNLNQNQQKELILFATKYKDYL